VGSKAPSSDCSGTSVAPASSTATGNRKSAAFLAMDVALVHEVNGSTSVAGSDKGIARNRRLSDRPLISKQRIPGRERLGVRYREAAGNSSHSQGDHPIATFVAIRS